MAARRPARPPDAWRAPWRPRVAAEARARPAAARVQSRRSLTVMRCGGCRSRLPEAPRWPRRAGEAARSGGDGLWPRPPRRPPGSSPAGDGSRRGGTWVKAREPAADRLENRTIACARKAMPCPGVSGARPPFTTSPSPPPPWPPHGPLPQRVRSRAQTRPWAPHKRRSRRTPGRAKAGPRVCVDARTPEGAQTQGRWKAQSRPAGWRRQSRGGIGHRPERALGGRRRGFCRCASTARLLSSSRRVASASARCAGPGSRVPLALHLRSPCRFSSCPLSPPPPLPLLPLLPRSPLGQRRRRRPSRPASLRSNRASRALRPPSRDAGLAAPAARATASRTRRSERGPGRAGLGGEGGGGRRPGAAAVRNERDAAREQRNLGASARASFFPEVRSSTGPSFALSKASRGPRRARGPPPLPLPPPPRPARARRAAAAVACRSLERSRAAAGSPSRGPRGVGGAGTCGGGRSGRGAGGWDGGRLPPLSREALRRPLAPRGASGRGRAGAGASASATGGTRDGRDGVGRRSRRVFATAITTMDTYQVRPPRGRRSHAFSLLGPLRSPRGLPLRASSPPLALACFPVALGAARFRFVQARGRSRR